MRIKSDDYTQEEYEELRQIVRENNCAECGGSLQVHTTHDGYLEDWCPHCRGNHGYIEKTTYTQEHRRGQDVGLVISDRIERKMMQLYHPGVLNLIKHRFPDAELDDPSAALFIHDCISLSLSPFLGEIVPVTFNNKKTNRRVVVPIITENGNLSLASRACPEDWQGPPRTMRIEDYLATQSQYKDRPYEEIKQIAADIKLDLCKDDKAYLWVAIGKRGGSDEEKMAYGWFKMSEVERKNKDGEKYTLQIPSAGLPGNQARVRAINRWCREVFPESKAKMQEKTAELLERAEKEDIPELTQVIEAEYHIIEEVPSKAPEGDDSAGAEDNKEEKRGEVPQATDEESQKGKKPSKKSEVRAARPARDPNTITNLGELYQACSDDFGLKNRVDVWHELGVTTQEDISDHPRDCYRQIAAARS